MATPSPYADRLKKILAGPTPQAPATLGSPSDRGPTQVPPIQKGADNNSIGEMYAKRKPKPEYS